MPRSVRSLELYVWYDIILTTVLWKTVLFYRQDNWSSARWRKLPRVPKFVHGEDDIWIQADSKLYDVLNAVTTLPHRIKQCILLLSLTLDRVRIPTPKFKELQNLLLILGYIIWYVWTCFETNKVSIYHILSLPVLFIFSLAYVSTQTCHILYLFTYYLSSPLECNLCESRDIFLFCSVICL